jgi:hypothetical protein
MSFVSRVKSKFVHVGAMATAFFYSAPVFAQTDFRSSFASSLQTAGGNTVAANAGTQISNIGSWGLLAGLGFGLIGGFIQLIGGKGWTTIIFTFAGIAIIPAVFGFGIQAFIGAK